MIHKLFYFSLFIGFVSCQNLSDLSNTSKLGVTTIKRGNIETVLLSKNTSYAKYLEQTDGSFGVNIQKTEGSPFASTSFTATFADNINHSVNIDGHEFTKLGEKQYVLSSEASMVNNPTQEMQENRTKIAQGLFGRQISVQFDGKAISYYLPKEINLVSSLTNQTLEMSKFRLSWNEDKNNTKGVVVIIKWGGEMSNETNTNRSSFQQSKSVIDIVEDNGFYEIGEQQLSYFPEGAILSIQVLRGEVDILNTEKGNYKFISYTSVTTPAFIWRKINKKS